MKNEVQENVKNYVAMECSKVTQAFKCDLTNSKYLQIAYSHIHTHTHIQLSQISTVALSLSLLIDRSIYIWSIKPNQKRSS